MKDIVLMLNLASVQRDENIPFVHFKINYGDRRFIHLMKIPKETQGPPPNYLWCTERSERMHPKLCPE